MNDRMTALFKYAMPNLFGGLVDNDASYLSDTEARKAFRLRMHWGYLAALRANRSPFTCDEWADGYRLVA